MNSNFINSKLGRNYPRHCFGDLAEKYSSGVYDRNYINWDHFCQCYKQIKYELENGANVEDVFANGYKLTAGTESDQVVFNHSIKILLRFRRIINTRNKYFETPLNELTKRYHFDQNLLKVFLFLGADPNIRGTCGFTPLHWLAKYRKNTHMKPFVEYARILLESKPIIDILNTGSCTPLHVSISEGSLVFVKMLLHYGADIFEKNGRKVTAMDIAYNGRQGNPQMFNLLARHAIVLDMCKLSIEQEHLTKFREIQGMQTIFNECDEELLKIKSFKIGNTTKTLYDILISPPETVAKYLRNENVFESLEKLETNIYCNLGNHLKNKFQEGLFRLEAENTGLTFCEKLFPQMPHPCLEKIIGHCSSKHLIDMKW